MDTSKAALISSAIYCGLGQVYKGRILKGINFIIIYTCLIVSFFFCPTSPLLHLLNLLIIMLMWLMGMVDAYMGDQDFIGSGRWLGWQKLPSVLSVIVIFDAVIVLVLSWTSTIPPVIKRPKSNSRQSAISPENRYAKNAGGAEASDQGRIAINACSLKPATAKPGAALAVEYTISVPEATKLGLGFSIQKTGTDVWIDDPANDMVVSVTPGNSSYFREFVLPTTLDSGKYNALWGLWASDFSAAYDSKRSGDALTVVIPSRDPDGNAGTYPDKRHIAISAYSLEPDAAKPGTTLTVRYTIHAPRSITVRLGCSIQKAGSAEWISDPDNDRMVIVSSGSDEYSREFSLPSILNSGEYNVALALWNQDLTVAYDHKLFSNDLTITTPPSDKDRSDVTRFFSVRVAAFKNRKNAEELCSKLLSKQYPARIEQSATGKWYFVLIGEFVSKQDAISFAKRSQSREGMTCVTLVTQHYKE